MEIKCLKCFQTIAILFIFGNLVGCQTVEQSPITPLVNEEKDKYITKVEQVVSDSASALTAVVGAMDKGTVRELAEAQVTRLSGLSKPSVEKVKYYTDILKQNDSKAIQRDKDEAARVDAETDALYSLVEQRDKEIAEANSRAEIAERMADRELKDKILWALSCLGMAISTAGVLVIAFTPWKLRGATLIGGGALAVASVWVLSSAWFQYVLISIAVLGVLDGLWLLLRWQIGKRNKAQGEPQQG